MPWQAEISTGSRVTNLRLKVSRFHGWSLPYWQAPLPIESIAEIVSHPEENSGAPPPFPHLCREVPCDGRHAAMIHWSRVETTFTHTHIYIYIHTIFYIIYIRLVFPLQKGRTRVRYEVSFSAFVIPKLVLGPPFCSKDTLGIL